jgi:hypothetical protein
MKSGYNLLENAESDLNKIKQKELQQEIMNISSEMTILSYRKIHYTERGGFIPFEKQYTAYFETKEAELKEVADKLKQRDMEIKSIQMAKPIKSLGKLGKK